MSSRRWRKLSSFSCTVCEKKLSEKFVAKLTNENTFDSSSVKCISCTQHNAQLLIEQLYETINNLDMRIDSMNEEILMLWDNIALLKKTRS